MSQTQNTQPEHAVNSSRITPNMVRAIGMLCIANLITNAAYAVRGAIHGDMEAVRNHGFFATASLSTLGAGYYAFSRNPEQHASASPEVSPADSVALPTPAPQNLDGN